MKNQTTLTQQHGEAGGVDQCPVEGNLTLSGPVKNRVEMLQVCGSTMRTH